MTDIKQAAAAATKSSQKPHKRQSSRHKHTGGSGGSGGTTVMMPYRQLKAKLSFTSTFYTEMASMVSQETFQGKSVVIFPGVVGGPVQPIAKLCGPTGKVLVIEPDQTTAETLLATYGTAPTKVGCAPVIVRHQTLDQFKADTKTQSQYDVFYWEPPWSQNSAGGFDVPVSAQQAVSEGSVIGTTARTITIPTVIVTGPFDKNAGPILEKLWSVFPLYKSVAPVVYHPQNAATVVVIHKRNQI